MVVENDEFVEYIDSPTISSVVPKYWISFMREPYNNKYAAGFATIFSIIWAALFAIFIFKIDINCSNHYLIDYAKLTFWMFILTIILEVFIFISVMLNKQKINQNKL